MRRRHMMATIGLVLALLGGGGCSAIQKITEAAERIERVAATTELNREKIEKFLAAVEGLAGQLGDKGAIVLDAVTRVREAFATADKNQDQKIVGIGEWQALLYALGSAIVGVFGSIVAGNAVKAKLTAHKTDIYARVDAINEKMKA